MQFPLRSLFRLLLVAAIASLAIKYLGGTGLLALLLVVSLAAALPGCAMLGFAVLCAAAIMISERDELRGYNLDRCYQLALLGLAFMGPLLILGVVTLLVAYLF